MFDFEIANLLKSNSDFKGVFSRDKIPQITSYPAAIIVNTDKSYEPGKHWIAMYFLEKQCEYFDSFGFPPMFPEMINAIGKRKLVWNGRCLQHPSSRKCGQFCIAFVKMRSRKESFVSFIKRFNADTKSNDRIVEYLSSDSF